jgi:hypothetical protein
LKNSEEFKSKRRKGKKGEKSRRFFKKNLFESFSKRAFNIPPEGLLDSCLRGSDEKRRGRRLYDVDKKTKKESAAFSKNAHA